jgi:hypothetical protein
MTRILNALVVLLSVAGLLSFAVRVQAANHIATPSTPLVAQATTASGAKLDFQITANMRQLMRGIFFPASNVVFAAQDDVGKIKEAEDAAVSPNPLTSIYGRWEAVQNAAVALSAASNLLLLPARLCSNGQPVPINRPDWAAFVQVMRTAAAASYKAALAKSTDQMVSVSYQLSLACDTCHKVYRDKYQKLGNQKVCEP